MNLKEFRDMYPGFKPYNKLEHKTEGYLEIISYPYEENDKILVKARQISHPLTMKTYNVDEFLKEY